MCRTQKDNFLSLLFLNLFINDVTLLLEKQNTRSEES